MLQWRYNPMVMDFKRALNDGALGRVMTIEAKILNGLVEYRDTSAYIFDPKTAGSGIMSWLGCHCLDLVLYLMQERRGGSHGPGGEPESGEDCRRRHGFAVAELRERQDGGRSRPDIT